MAAGKDPHKTNLMDNLTYFRRQNRELAVKDRLQWLALALFGVGVWLMCRWVG